ncbi:MAG: mechanosensitive ion channel family protein [Desulfovibrio sp.]|jgi:small-conductance mechanosensitive channel
MAEIIFTGNAHKLTEHALAWFHQHLASEAALLQLLLGLGLWLAAWGLCRVMGLGGTPKAPDTGWKADALVAPLLRKLRANAWPGVAGLLLLLADAVAIHFELPHQVLAIASAIALAWVVAHVASALIRNRPLRRLAAWSIWLMAVLHAIGLLHTARVFLDEIALNIGHARISLLLVLKGLALFVLLFQAARLTSSLLDDRLRATDGISPSAQALLSKGARFGMYVLALGITLSSVGVDLTTLTVFSGAVGVGVGFGLQKIFSNLVSGVILLVDKSLKPGDVIEVGGVQGRIAQINARYASIETLDGKAYLIPNESLISNEVINLSYSNSQQLLKAEVGVAYGGDPRQAMALMERAAGSVPRVLKDPAPAARLAAFGDSSVNLFVGFWIDDPENGTANVRSDVLLAIWDAFQQAGIQIPFPQREVRMLTDGQESGGLPTGNKS